jgi:ribulose-5-phosphate 4-epimerase/fuculose-1-phosphate aldolase
MDQDEAVIAAKRTLIEAGAILAYMGHGDMTRGHVSLRTPHDPSLFYMKPHSVGLDEITMDSVLTIDLDGKVVAGTARRHSEVFIHSEILRARSDVNAVIHTHATHTVAFSATGHVMRPVSQGGALFAERLPAYTDTINLIRTPEMGQGLAAALGPHKAVLLRNHGLAMTGRSLEEAVICCIMLEEACRVQLLAEAAGIDAEPFPESDIAKLRDNLLHPEQCTINFAYLARKAGVRPKLGA